MNKKFFWLIVLGTLTLGATGVMYGCGKSETTAKFTIVGSGE